jgi:hypothetical protein
MKQKNVSYGEFVLTHKCRIMRKKCTRTEISMKKLWERKLSLVLILLQLLLSAGSIVLIAFMELLPVIYLVIISVTAIFLLAYTVVSQITDKSKVVGRILSGIYTVIFVLFACYGFFTYEDLKGIDIQNPEGPISYLVLADDRAQTIEDLEGYRFGILSDSEQTDTETEDIISSLNNKFDKEIESIDFYNMDSMIEGLYTEHVQVIVFEETFRNSVMENHAMFEVDTRIINQG